MVKGKEMIEFEISDRCSGALNEIIQSRGWQEKESFTLPIKKGSIFPIIEKLVPNCICCFHVGCTSDSRPPNFEYWKRVGDLRKNDTIDFYYRRWLELNIFWKNNWFHDKNGMRDLEATAIALSNPKSYREEIGLQWSGSYEGCGRSASIELIFESNQLKEIRGLDEFRAEVLRVKIKGFKNSFLDLKNGSLKDEKSKFLDEEDWVNLFKQKGIGVKDLIKELYELFQNSVINLKIEES